MPKPHLHKTNMNLRLRDNSHVGINCYNMQYVEILNTLTLGHMCWPEVGEKRPSFFGAGSSLEVGGSVVCGKFLVCSGCCEAVGR